MGGTEFNEGQGFYWSPIVGPNGGTALSYIPETTWNDENIILSLGQTLIAVSYSGWGFAAGGGGASIYWGKPEWQAGLGVPNDGVRDVPDVSFTASGIHDPYYVLTGGQPGPNGGTSASAPVFAGMLALVNQYLVGNGFQQQPGLGNIYPMLYFMGQNAPSVYHDVTAGSNSVPCIPGSTQDCGPSGWYGYPAGPGYDLATGWGSVDVAGPTGAWANIVRDTAKLVITSFNMPAQATFEGQVNSIVQIQNQGEANAGPFQVRTLLTTDGTQATANSWYVYCDVNGLNAGQTVTCSGAVTLGPSVTPGRYSPLAIADYYDQVAQYNRTGNFAYSSNLTMTVR